MKHINLFLILFCLLVIPVRAGEDQPTFLHGYRDFRNFLYIFENGTPRQLEQQVVRSFKAKGSMIAYANNANDLMVYYKGEKFKLGDMTATNYELTQSMMYFQRDLMLSRRPPGSWTCRSCSPRSGWRCCCRSSRSPWRWRRCGA